MRRSELVTVPSFSPQLEAGSSRSANSAVSVLRNASCTTTNSARSSPARTSAASGIDCAGLVHAIHTARTSPSRSARNSSTAVLPGSAGTWGTPHSFAISARCLGLARSRCAESRLAMPPTSRPPMAFGWPVSEKGPAPGLPICPVARCRWMSAALLCVPWVDWFKPWHHSDRLARDFPNQRAAVTMSFAATPHTDAAVKHRVRHRGVRSRDQEALGEIDVLVAGRRRVGAERRLVTGSGRGHAQAGIGIHVVRADEALGELVEDIVVLGQELAGDVEGDAVRAVRADGRGEARGGVVERLVPRHAPARLATIATQLGMQRAQIGPGGKMQRRPFGAQAPEIGRMIGVAAHPDDAFPLACDHHAAAHAAIATS